MSHVRSLADANHDLNLLPTDSGVVLKRFKTTMRKIFWEGLGNCVEKVFVGRKGKFVSEFQNSRMTTLSVLDDSCSMDVFFFKLGLNLVFLSRHGCVKKL